MPESAFAPLDAGVRAALEAKKPVTFVCPPAAWAAVPLLSAIPDSGTELPRLLILVPDLGDVLDVARTLHPFPGFEPILPVTGLSRASRLLGVGAARTLVVALRDAIRLLETSRLKLGSIAAIAVMWPEQMIAMGDGSALDTLLAEAGESQRLIITSDADGLKDFIERQARRSPTGIGSQLPAQSSGTARYVMADGERRLGTVRAILDTLNPTSTLLWEPSPDRYERWIDFAEDPSVTVSDKPPEDRKVAVVIAVELPSAEMIARLAAAATEVIVLLRPSQLPYLQRMVRSLKSIRLAGAADRAREQAHAMRQSVRERIESGDAVADLLALGPLFDEYDPALVAAALVRGSVKTVSAEPEAPAAPAWVRLHVTIGKKDKARPADLVGALLNGVGLPKDHVGKIDLRDTFSIVEIRAEDAARAQRGMSGLVVRGKKLTVRTAT